MKITIYKNNMVKIMVYDIVIIGGGPAGLTSGIYGMRAKLNIICIEKENEGGKIAEAGEVENYPGFESIKGYELAQNFVNHSKKFGLNIIHDNIISIDTSLKPFKLKGEKGEYETKSVIIATGTKDKTLGINEEEYVGKGVSYCTTCDAFFYVGKTVIVVGKGTAGVMSALNLKDIVKEVILITEDKEIKVAEQIMLDRLNNSENIKVITNAKPLKIVGEETVKGIIVEINGLEKEINGDGIFISMGHIPNSDIVKDNPIELTKGGFIKVDKNCKTNIEGIFACGDVTGGMLQVSKAVGEGAIALANASKYLNKLEK